MRHCIVTDEVDILPEDMDPKLQGLDSFESSMGSLGLTERKPVPDPVRFTEPDPLGANVLQSGHQQHDVVASISEYKTATYSEHTDIDKDIDNHTCSCSAHRQLLKEH